MKYLKHIDDYLANLCILVIVLITILSVFMRYLLNNPLQWIEEVLTTLYLWAIMLGAVSAMKDRGHVSIDVMVAYLPQKAKKYLQTVVDLIGIVILITFGILGLKLALAAGDKITPILQIKYAYIDLAVPIGAFLMAGHLLLHLIKDNRKDKSNKVGQTEKLGA